MKCNQLNPQHRSGQVIATSSGTRTATPDLISLMIKSTPGVDGSIIHVVGYGQSLWSIATAYKIKIDQIRALNGIPQDYSTINTGQELLIQPAFTPTATFSSEEIATLTKMFEPTTPPATSTKTTTRTPLPSPSPTLTATTLPEEKSESGQNPTGLVVMGISLVGLVVVVIFGFIKIRVRAQKEQD